MTLVLTPMMMLSGVFFPVEQLPAAVQAVAQALPLYHGVALVRPLLLGEVAAGDPAARGGARWPMLSAASTVAVLLTRRRLLDLTCSGSSRCTSCSW